MSYPDDELDSLAPGRRETAADEAARLEDQAGYELRFVDDVRVIPSGPPLIGSSDDAALLDEPEITFTDVRKLITKARYHGQPLRVTATLREMIEAAVERYAAEHPRAPGAAAPLNPTEVIVVDGGDKANVWHHDGEWQFRRAFEPLVHLGSNADLANQLNAPRVCPHDWPIDNDDEPCGKCEDDYIGIGEIS